MKSTNLIIKTKIILTMIFGMLIIVLGVSLPLLRNILGEFLLPEAFQEKSAEAFQEKLIRDIFSVLILFSSFIFVILGASLIILTTLIITLKEDKQKIKIDKAKIQEEEMGRLTEEITRSLTNSLERLMEEKHEDKKN